MTRKEKTVRAIILQSILLLFLSLPTFSEGFISQKTVSTVFAQDVETKMPSLPAAQSSDAVQWNHNAMNIDEAWRDGYTGEGVTIAILDTGFYHQHPDLMMAGGYSVFPDDAWSNDHSGHGTHVAGIIGASQGTVYQGIAPGADLYGIKIYHEDDVDENGAVSTDVESVIKGFREAIRIEADIILLSSGLTYHDENLYEVIQEAYNEDILIIAASGNGNASVNYPAIYPEVVAVTAVDERLHPALDIIHGDENEFAAPGVNIGGLSIPDSTYSYPYIFMSGSSQAAPHAAGLAAILMEKHRMRGQELREVMQTQALDIGDPGLFGFGLLRYVSDTEDSADQPASLPEQDETPPEEAVVAGEGDDLTVRKPSSSREADTEEQPEMTEYFRTDALEQNGSAVLGYDVLPIVETGGTLEIELDAFESLLLAADQISEIRDRNIRLILSKGSVKWTIPPANFLAGEALLRFYEGTPTGVNKQTGSVTPVYTISIYQDGTRQEVYPSWMEIAFEQEDAEAADIASLEGYAWDKAEGEWFETIIEEGDGSYVISTRHTTAVGVFNPDEIVEEEAVVETEQEAVTKETPADNDMSQVATQILLGALIFGALLLGVRFLINKRTK